MVSLKLAVVGAELRFERPVALLEISELFLKEHLSQKFKLSLSMCA